MVFRYPHDFSKLMDLLYVIRNNLFHGHKSPNDEDDLRIVGDAFNVLSFLMTYVDKALREGK